MKLPLDRFYMNIERVGNTSAASIPIALCDAIREGRLRPNDNVALVGFGGGLSWASTVVKWDVLPREVSFPNHEWRQVRYVLARGRSRLRRAQRQLGAYIARTPAPPGPGDDVNN
jgi:3-oxoacyl-[acyl-carrier-protein] synthase-3